MNEEYKICPEPYTNYKINRSGDVFNIKTGRQLRWYKNKEGYKYLTLYSNGKKQNRNLHRLLGMSFISNPNNLPVVDHINRQKLDNDLDNLRWVSISQNNINTDPDRFKYGVPGIVKSGKKYGVNFYRGGNRIWLGTYSQLEDAIKTYKEAADNWLNDHIHTVIF